MQFAINAVYLASQIAPVAVGLTLIYAVSKYLSFAHGAAYVVGAYATFGLTSLGAPLILAVAGGVVATAIFGAGAEATLFRHLHARKASGMVLLLASLGLFIIVQGGVALVSGDDVKTLRVGDAVAGYVIFGARATGIQIIGLIGNGILCAAVSVALAVSGFGKQARATADDSELATALGVEINQIRTYVALIASSLAGVAGIVNGYDVGLRPTMGFQPLLLGVVAMLVGGAGRPLGACCGAMCLAAAQQASVVYLPSQWQDTVVYALLACALFVRPSGLPGGRCGKRVAT